MGKYLYTAPVLEFHVGLAPEIFKVPSDLFDGKCDPLARMCKSDFRESSEGVAEISDLHPGCFSALLEFAHHGKSCVSTDTAYNDTETRENSGILESLPPTINAPQSLRRCFFRIHFYLRTYILGDRYLYADLKQHALHSLRQDVSTSHYLGAASSLHHEIVRFFEVMYNLKREMEGVDFEEIDVLLMGWIVYYFDHLIKIPTFRDRLENNVDLLMDITLEIQKQTQAVTHGNPQ